MVCYAMIVSRSCLCPGQGFAEIVHHRIAVKICGGDIENVASFCAQEQAPPQVRLCTGVISLRILTTARITQSGTKMSGAKTQQAHPLAVHV